MALQDLTPQLRTRLSRMERAVGWFVVLATALLVFGFSYYVYNTAKRKGWFISKIQYQTSIESVAGLKVGDPVKLMGFDVGEITRIVPNDPWDYYNITVFFNIKAPNYGYLLSDSTAKVAAADFLGHRFLEVTKGVSGVPTVEETTNNVAVGMLKRDYVANLQEEMLKTNKNLGEVLGLLNQMAKTNRSEFYTKLTKHSVYWLDPAESPALTERLERVVTAVEKALPGFLTLTNRIAAALSSSADLVSNLNVVALNAQPASSNLSYITAQLRGPGSLGEWALGTQAHRQTGEAIANANLAIAHTDTNLTALLDNLGRSLDNLAGITSNLNTQVQMNTNMLSAISSAIVDADDLVQGLKRHWLLRSAFRTKTTNAPPSAPRLASPKDQGNR
jgi:ABC-type transporter Mla subunit MlaD